MSDQLDWKVDGVSERDGVVFRRLGSAQGRADPSDEVGQRAAFIDADPRDVQARTKDLVDFG